MFSSSVSSYLHDHCKTVTSILIENQYPYFQIDGLFMLYPIIFYLLFAALHVQDHPELAHEVPLPQAAPVPGLWREVCPG